MKSLPPVVAQALESLNSISADRPQGFGFAEFSTDELTAIFSIAQIHQFSKSEILVSNQETTSDLYFVLQGQLKIEIPVPNGETKDFLLTPGTVVGEQSFLDEEPRSATVVAETSCLIASFDAGSFRELTRMHLDVALRIIRQLYSIISFRLRMFDLLQ